MKRAVWPLALLVAGALVMILLGFPLRTYMSQRAALSRAHTTLATLSAQNKTLQQQAAQLQSPAEIEYLARADYGLVQPGQEAYALLPGSAPASTTQSTIPGSTIPGSTIPGLQPPPTPPTSTAPAATTAGTDSSGGSLWSRFLQQLEFWR